MVRQVCGAAAVDPPGLPVLSEQEPPAGGALQQEGTQIRHCWHTAKEQENGCVSKLVSAYYKLMLKILFFSYFFSIGLVFNKSLKLIELHFLKDQNLLYTALHLVLVPSDILFQSLLSIPLLYRKKVVDLLHLPSYLDVLWYTFQPSLCS